MSGDCIEEVDDVGWIIYRKPFEYAVQATKKMQTTKGRAVLVTNISVEFFRYNYGEEPWVWSVITFIKPKIDDLQRTQKFAQSIARMAALTAEEDVSSDAHMPFIVRCQGADAK